MFDPTDLTLYDNDPIEYYFRLYQKINEIAGDTAMLVGNVLLNKVITKDARATKDLDMHIPRELDFGNIREYLELVRERLLDEDVISSYIVEDPEEFHSGGIKCYAGSNNTATVSIDISMDDRMENRRHVYNINDVAFNGNSLEAIICDKCSASLSRKRFRGAKDFYDLYILHRSRVKWDIEKTLDIMISKVGYAEVRDLISHFPFSEEIMEQMNQAWGRLKLTNTKNRTLAMEKQPWSVVYTDASVFYTCIQYALENRRGEHRWTED